MYMGQKDGRVCAAFPLGDGLAGAGVGAYWYSQVTGDSGSGANFGDFKAKTNGIGAVVSYVSKLDGKKVLAEFLWLHEFGVQNRLSGDILFLKAMLFFE